ncbi:MAG: hypothetical protein K2X86_15615 [Cytophagaceae bacterium]|nr:hypothetical protein [Cytophagaceae bacterium]
MKEKTTELKKHLSKLFEKSLRISAPLHMLEMTRQKLEERSLQSFDKEDILNELGSIQHTMRELNSEMLRIHDLLKK